MGQVHQPANVSKVKEFVHKRVLVDWWSCTSVCIWSFGMIQIFAKQFGQGNLVQRDKSQYDSFQGFFRVSNWEQPPTCSLKEMISTKNFPLQGTYFEVDFRFVCTRMPAIHSSSQPAFFCCGIACFSSCSRKILRHLTWVAVHRCNL